jgi:hypothetical protein
MFQYVCFYRGKQCVVEALRSYDAQLAAAKIFKARKAYEIAVVLAGKDGQPIPVNPAAI